MSLYGYKPKTKPANWLGVAGAQPVRARIKDQHDAKATATVQGRRVKFIRQRSKLGQKRSAEYVAKARAFVRAAVKRGEVCPVWLAIKELHDGVKYGWQISGKPNEVHHTRGRAGSLLTDERYWIAVSKQGHRWIHEHPTEARRRGWLCEAGLWNTQDRSAP